MIDTFRWKTQIQNQQQVSYTRRVRSVQFGDGYKQISEDGINSELQSWPIIYTGHSKEVLEVRDFLRAHVVKPFIWTPPFGEKGLFRVSVEPITLTPLGPHTLSVNAVFEQTFEP
ncbi:phage tail protein [Pragia fontium]|uniref:phage tail protein n=1 Tax=Pragia fontium TaxID=82985 RepID=UPI00064AA182|nr:phage tail protein [Pragia fontium]AKJ41479.1 phage tail protein [Pragia fontium]